MSRDQFFIFKPYQPAFHFKAYWILRTLCGFIFFISLTVWKILMKTCDFFKLCWFAYISLYLYVRKNKYFSNANCSETIETMEMVEFSLKSIEKILGKRNRPFFLGGGGRGYGGWWDGERGLEFDQESDKICKQNNLFQSEHISISFKEVYD